MNISYKDKCIKTMLNLRYAFQIRKPLLTLRLFNAVFSAWILRKPPLRYVDFAIDFKCNLRCKHCFAVALVDSERSRMKPEDYGNVARQAMALGTVNFSFQGGEPLLYKNLAQIVHSCYPHKNLISITTNGTLLTHENLEMLRRIGVDILTVSLDSSIAEEHDGFRGVPGSYERTMEGIDLALKMGFRITIGTVVTHDSLMKKGIQGLISFAKSRRTILYFILPVPAGKWISENDMMLTSEDLDYIDRITGECPFIRTDLQANLGPYGCGAAKEILYLTPYGDVLPCPFMHIEFGNALRTPLADIRKSMLKNPWLKRYHKKCLVSSDAKFVDEHLAQTFTATSLPMPAEQVFDSVIGYRKNR